jgi:hypothetical protein
VVCPPACRVAIHRHPATLFYRVLPPRWASTIARSKSAFGNGVVVIPRRSAGASFAKTRTPPGFPMGRGLGNPQGYSSDIVNEGSTWETHGRARGSSRNIRHEEPIGDTLLEVPDHRCLASWDRNRQRLAREGSELDNVCAIILRTIDHDPVLAVHRHFFLPHSSSASRFTAGASEFFISCMLGGSAPTRPLSRTSDSRGCHRDA